MPIFSKQQYKRIDKHIQARSIDDLLRAFENEKKEDPLLSEIDATTVVIKLQDSLDKIKTTKTENTVSPDVQEIVEKTKEADFNPHKAHLQTEAIENRNKAQAAHEVIAKAKTIPQGMDFNLPNADLNHTQENVFAETLAADADINKLLADATSKDEQASKISKLKAITVTKNILGKDTCVISAKPGETYQGEIIAKTDVYAIQRITNNQAVLHDIKDISDEANAEIGARITLFNRGDKTIIQENTNDSQNLENEDELEEGYERERGSS